MTFDNNNNYNNSSTINHDTSKIMLSAIFSLSFVIILVIILHIYVRCALRLPRRQFTTPSSAFVYSHHVRHVEPVPTKTGLDPMVINSIPSFLYTQLDGHDQSEECPVCLSMLENDELARRLPNCNHIFHVECIDTWLSGQSTCPICRSDVVPQVKPLDREPPRGGESIEIAVVTLGSDRQKHDQKGRVGSSSIGVSSSKVISNGSEPSTSSSFRLSSFRKIVGRDRSSSSRRIQVNSELDIESQGQQ